MIKRSLFSVLVVLFLAAQTLPSSAMAEDSPKFVPDKLLCAKMIRFGQEAYQRGRFQDAKEFFRRATISDPGSKKAWRFYDQSVLFALAEKVEAKENRDLLSAGTSMGARIKAPSQQTATQLPAASTSALEPSPEVSAPVQEADMDDSEPEEEEGC